MSESKQLSLRYRNQLKGLKGQSHIRVQGQLEKAVNQESSEKQYQRIEMDKLDERFGYYRYIEGPTRTGWLLNYVAISMPDASGQECSGVDLFFIDKSGDNFKATILYRPYFYLDISDINRINEVANYIIKRFEGCQVIIVEKEDLDMSNHLAGIKHKFLKLSFNTVNQLVDTRNALRTIVDINQKNEFLSQNNGNIINSDEIVSGGISVDRSLILDPSSFIIDFREYDVPYLTRVAIDLHIYVGSWYNVTPELGNSVCTVEWLKDMLELCEPGILAYDIECEKSPLKFPNPESDRIYMISYMYNGDGYLIINREIVAEDIPDFEYTPKPAYPGKFKVFNVANEAELLQTFLREIYILRPHVIVTYNGDKFDMPYIEIRLHRHGINMSDSLGIRSTISHPFFTSTSSSPTLSKLQTFSSSNSILPSQLDKNTTTTSYASASPNHPTLSLFQDTEFVGRGILHLDAFRWVQRDSYLPQGNQSLKSVAYYKLGYQPIEIDPEMMLTYAMGTKNGEGGNLDYSPQAMAAYSVSDAVATYYLYKNYVHNFIFSLATIIPLGAEDVLRKGSGTLCESLLMIKAYENNIVYPNKQIDEAFSYKTNEFSQKFDPNADPNSFNSISLNNNQQKHIGYKFYNGHVLESETYIGGHVECLEAGVFRADIEEEFNMVPSALQSLIDKVDRDLCFLIEIESGIQREDIVNYDEVRQDIICKLEMLRDHPKRKEFPLIYHLDVGAMYPNIILTNRLQPSAMVSLKDCASCKYNSEVNQCKRKMVWTWRGEYNPASYSEFLAIQKQLSYERFPMNNEEKTNENGTNNQNLLKSFNELTEKQQSQIAKKRLKLYSQKVYKKSKVTSIEERISTVCMRENSFYVDTVKAFRDRRYDYKLLTKVWKNKKAEAERAGNYVARKQAEDRETLMDSLQLAHKCILNSFYGYVMRKGARWRSMEMAGIVTHTGAQLIRQARELVEQVGRPLELDTDGIWCILPSTFPNDYKLKTKSGKSVSMSYPCAMLNADVHENYTNHQYQNLKKNQENSEDAKKGLTNSYNTHSECSIFFELDGPYRAMVLPASPEEGRLLKKKYVVFNFDGSIAELKGFELKRRGELELVKTFQSQVFEQFLKGKTLQECYNAVASIANQWLDVLDEQGRDMDDQELLELISERKTISKTVEDYEGRKSTSLTTASRLADFLGAEMIKDKGLNCHLVISRLPAGAPVTERAIPLAIFGCEPAMKRFFLRKWLKDNTLDCEDFRSVIDWDYYKERLGKTIQKIVTIPAGMQRIPNPVPRVEHPIWLQRSLASIYSGKKQLLIKDTFFKKSKNNEIPKANDDFTMDIEDIGSSKPTYSISNKNSRKIDETDIENDDYETDIEKKSKVLEVSEEKEVLHADPLMINPPQTVGEFKNWLKTRKSEWKVMRMKKQAEIEKLNRQFGISSSFNTHSIGHGTSSTGVLQFVRNANLAAAIGIWQIIELQEKDIPGEFVAWVLTSPNQLQRIDIEVPRQFYLHLYKNATPAAIRAVEKIGGKRIEKDLPHGKELQLLFEITMNELKYQEKEELLNNFLASSASFCEGAYETQVPLWFRAILSLGCVAKVSNPSSNKKKYLLNELEMLKNNSFSSSNNSPSLNYLTTETSSFKKIYIYLSAVPSNSLGSLGILGIFFFQSTNLEEKEELEQLLKSMEEENDEKKKNYTEETLYNKFIGKLPKNITAYIWIINGRSKVPNTVSITKTFKNLLKKQEEEANNNNLSQTLEEYNNNIKNETKFHSQTVKTLEQAFRAANDRLTKIQREKNGVIIAFAQGGLGSKASKYLDNIYKQQQKIRKKDQQLSNLSQDQSKNEDTYEEYIPSSTMYGLNARQWRAALPALFDFPLSALPANSLDENYPLIQWETYSITNMLKRFLAFPAIFLEKLIYSRQGSIPLCNFFNSDNLINLIDIKYARSLINNKHILWISSLNNQQPDIGQQQIISTNSYQSNAVSNINSFHLFNDEETNEENSNKLYLNKPGVYRDYCVEIDLYGLTVSAILNSGDLDTLNDISAGVLGSALVKDEEEVEGENIEENDEKKPKNSKENNNSLVLTTNTTSSLSCAKSFSTLRYLLQTIFEELKASSNSPDSSSNKINDHFLSAIYSYLTGNGGGLLSDPLLKKMAQKLSLRLFNRLIQTLHSLGVKVFYGDINRLFLSTQRINQEGATEYINFILTALRNGQAGGGSAIQMIDLSIKKIYRQVLWLDSHNFSCLKIKEDILRDEEIQRLYQEQLLNEMKLQEEAENLLREEEEIRRKHREELKEQQQYAKHQKKREKKLRRLNNEDDQLIDSDEEMNEDEDTNDDNELFNKDEDIVNFNFSNDDNDITKIKKLLKGPSSSRISARNYLPDEYDDIYDRDEFDSGEEVDPYVDNYDEDREFDDDEEEYNKSLKMVNYNEEKRKINQIASSINNLSIENEEKRNQVIKEEETIDLSIEIDQHWHILLALPLNIRVNFLEVVNEYLFKFSEITEELSKNGVNLTEEEAKEFLSASTYIDPSELDDELLLKFSYHFFKKWIETDLTTHLLTVVEDFLAFFNSHETKSLLHSSSKFNSLSLFDNVSLINKNTTLDFIRNLVYCLSLDEKLKENITTLKRILLLLIRVPEFSPESDYLQYNSKSIFSHSYLLNDIICSFCNNLRDLDLLRDPCFFSFSSSTSRAAQGWKCPYCSHEINKTMIENRLIQHVEKLSIQFLLQDFRCPKTHQVNLKLFATHSLPPVCLPLQMDHPVNEIMKNLKTLLIVANTHNFTLLKSYIEELIQ